MSGLIKIIEAMVCRSKNYCIGVVDLDYLIRYCMQFDHDSINRLKQNIDNYFYALSPEKPVWHDTSSDEYVFLFLETNGHEAFIKMENMRKTFTKQRFFEHVSGGYERTRMNFSAGVAAYPAHGANPEMVYRAAVVSLNQSKAMRRGKVTIAPDASALSKKDIVYLNSKAKISVVLGAHGQVGKYAEHEISCKNAGLSEPQAICMDENDVLYIADQNNHAVMACKANRFWPIAGCGAYGYEGDGGAATKAKLNKPTGLAVHNNRLFITDTGNDAVRAVNLLTGIIDTFAGIGDPGWTGDGGPAKNARLNKPGGVAVDNAGTVFINDIANNVVRKVTANNLITTYAGNGKYGADGDGGDAIEAHFAEIYGICTDRDGNLYLADYFNQKIRMVDARTGIVRTVAGSGMPGYSGDGGPPCQACLDRPVAVWVSDNGNIYIAESNNNSVRVVIKESNRIYTLAGDGVFGYHNDHLAAKIRFANPNGLAGDTRGNLYILDGSNNRICKTRLN